MKGERPAIGGAATKTACSLLSPEKEHTDTPAPIVSRNRRACLPLDFILSILTHLGRNHLAPPPSSVSGGIKAKQPHLHRTTAAARKEQPSPPLHSRFFLLPRAFVRPETISSSTIDYLVSPLSPCFRFTSFLWVVEIPATTAATGHRGDGGRRWWRVLLVVAIIILVVYTNSLCSMMIMLVLWLKEIIVMFSGDLHCHRPPWPWWQWAGIGIASV